VSHKRDGNNGKGCGPFSPYDSFLPCLDMVGERLECMVIQGLEALCLGCILVFHYFLLFYGFSFQTCYCNLKCFAGITLALCF
jgi:hypothetical protein